MKKRVTKEASIPNTASQAGQHHTKSKNVREHNDTSARDETQPKKSKSLLYQYDDLISETALSLCCLLNITVLATVTRLYNIDIPKHICWDETHFGKMGSWYLNRTFFFDVHPPLGKMLIGLFGYLSGYDGSFPFDKPGDLFDKDEQFVGMRICCALLGACIVPLCYMCLRELGQSIMAATFAALLVLLDTGTTTLSRYILLDPILIFFIILSTLFLLKFINSRHRPFSVHWWMWMCLTGISLACSIGVKFVGLFVILLAGFTTAWDLWTLLGDLSLSLTKLGQHLAARALCLIVLPSVVYSIFFVVHFAVLNKSGSGDGFFSSAFQSQLVGNKLYNTTMPQNMAYGSLITIKQSRTAGGYLHSHTHLYPLDDAPKQQQVTTYSHKDVNNYWRVKPYYGELNTYKPVHVISSGDLLRLEHIETTRNLHSHREMAPVSKRHYQVTGYGLGGEGDENDVWVVDVPGRPTGTPVHALTMQFRLVHHYIRCALQSHDKRLPKWGWEQLEVSCNPNIRDPNTLWNIEEVIDERLPNVSIHVYSPNFVQKLIETHAVMTQGNSGLKPKEGEVYSRPWQWPINYKGQAFSGNEHRVYLLGNPVIFWMVMIVGVIFLVLYSVHAVLTQRRVQCDPSITEHNERVFPACWWLVLAWFLHYAPFWPMTRVLYFHHYFPAFIYSCMFSGVVIDYTITRVSLLFPWRHTAAHIFTGVCLSAITYSFYLFHPLTYGMSGPNASNNTASMHGLKWLQSWDF